MTSRAFPTLQYALAITILVFASACGSSTSTNVTSPTNTRCQANVVGSGTTFGPAGGTGTLTINVARECPWSATSQTSWIVITSDREGQGDGSVTFRVAENPDPVNRRGNVVVSERGVELSQEAAPCRFGVAPPDESASAAGGQLTIGVATHAMCRWTATSEAPWALVSPSSGQGSGEVRVTFADNPGASRTTGVTVAGERLLVTQRAAGAEPLPPTAPGPGPGPGPSPCSVTLSPTEQSFTAAGGTGLVRVTAASACTWSAASNASWVVISSATSGSGSADVLYAVAPNADTSSREATLTIAGSSHRVIQSGATLPAGGRVELEGSVGSLTGTCPNLRFVVRGTAVITNSSTRFSGGNCQAVRNGRPVEVEGRLQADGTVLADRVEIDD